MRPENEIGGLWWLKVVNSDAKVQYKGLSGKLCDHFGFLIHAIGRVGRDW
jgi:hypothetical protein